ncbi:transcriptional regulatory protein, IclR family [Azotobacter vinelandii CA]|uniref:HTH-type transcriptional repressor AllR n=2 Tax=Azotobacter vinelandii TaxID=354 RepID=C1DQT2_AZOVD|nr:IclR family transcriptional regulator [Azotobacter vinelandii]ACO77605.1 transcriptional regulatory protein, IclR family [Azotobacter vinelandii DJ]AGK15337.1 transcriptional regulatory protein, IclR family [Azotobacter vinelandii CA]AGK19881.1 transcriptional regulatory protein, IclR family [Azotobacter vinelandii CA6]WKN23380.1 IclR family transcriptional regulator [Azotobacter vinelandii]SFX98402.1 transcriptional regulator, IclR family [Azotobacter vinelandii]
MTGEQTERRSKGSSISRVLEIVEAVAQSERALSPAELAFMLDIPKPSIHRLLQQLQADGYLQVDLRGLIVPSDRLQRIAMGVLYASRHKALRRSILQRVARETGETCGIAIPDGIDMVYYDRVQSNWPLQIHLPVGSHVPMWCSASGKLYLSSFSRARRQQILRNLPLTRLSRNTITDPQELEAALQSIAETGLGVDNEEFIDGMVACSVPIRGPEGRLHACLFVHAPTLRRNLDELEAMEPLLRRAADELAELLLEARPQDGLPSA